MPRVHASAFSDAGLRDEGSGFRDCRARPGPLSRARSQRQKRSRGNLVTLPNFRTGSVGSAATHRHTVFSLTWSISATCEQVRYGGPEVVPADGCCPITRTTYGTDPESETR